MMKLGIQILMSTLIVCGSAWQNVEAVDFGDYTSETLTTKAWQTLSAKDADLVLIYTKKCLDLYTKEASKQQASLTTFASKEEAFNYWALNDVGTCYFIMGEALMLDKKWQEAYNAYKTCYTDFSFSQCWDPKGWFWKPAVASRGKNNKLRAEHPEVITE